MSETVNVVIAGTPTPIVLFDANTLEAANQAGLAIASANASEASAAAAQALVGPVYADTATGLAATAPNGFFAVNDAGIVTIYQDVAGVAVAQRTLPTSATLAASGGSALVGFLQAGTGAVTRDAEDKMRDVVSVKDFGAVGDGVTDDTVAIQAAVNSGKSVFFPDGQYVLSATVSNSGSVNIFGIGGVSVAGNDPQTAKTGAVILWEGSNSGTVLNLDPANASTIKILGIKVYVKKEFTGIIIKIKAGRVTSELKRGIVEIDGLGLYRTPLDYVAPFAPGNSTSIGIYFDVVNATSDSFACIGHKINNVYAFNLGTLFKVEVSDAAVGGENFFNSNFFSNVYGYQVYRILHLISGTLGRSEITANTFSSFQNQPGLDNIGLAADGVIRFENKVIANTFFGIKIWDVPDNKKLVAFNPVGSDSNGLFINRFYGANLPPADACVIQDDLRNIDFHHQYKIWAIGGSTKLKLDADGLKFNGATASTDALNDYKEGTFTPTIAFGGGSTGVTYSTASGTYTKIGRVVHYAIDLVLTSKGSSTGNATIGGLPFTSSSGPTHAMHVSEFYDLAFASAYPVCGFVAPTNTTIVLRKHVSATFVQSMTDADFANNTTFRISGQYFV